LSSQSSLVGSRWRSWCSLLLLLRLELLLLLILELLLLLLRLELLLLLRYNSIFPVKLLLNGNGKHLRVEAEELFDGEPLNLGWI